jgi:uncharacterized membrane protein YesL
LKKENTVDNKQTNKHPNKQTDNTNNTNKQNPAKHIKKSKITQAKTEAIFQDENQNQDLQEDSEEITPKQAKKLRRKLFWAIFRTRFFENCELNFVYLICCIPIFTIGPATAGLVKIMRNFATDRPVRPVRDFFVAFGQNFKPALGMGLLSTLVLTGCASGFYVYGALASRSGAIWYVLFGICALMAMIVIFMNFYAYLMLVGTDLSFRDIVKNSFAFSIVALKINFTNLLICGALLAVMAVLVVLWTPLMTLLAFLPFAINWYIITFRSYPIVEKYAIRELVMSDEE